MTQARDGWAVLQETHLTVREVLDRLGYPVNPRYIRRLPGKDGAIYLPWTTVCDILDERAVHWSFDVLEIGMTNQMDGNKDDGYKAVPHAYARARITVHCADGDIFRESIGVDDDPFGQRGGAYERAIAKTLCRCAVMFGVGRELYLDKSTGKPYESTRDRWDAIAHRRALRKGADQPAESNQS